MERHEDIAASPIGSGAEAATEEALATARQLHKEGRLEAARDLLTSLLASQPGAVRVAFQCASVSEAAGREREAVGLYERALAGLLPREERHAALIGLGSTTRSLGHYQQSLSVLQQGRQEFPTSRAMRVFLAMTLYNVGDHRVAMEYLLRALAETSRDPALRRYRQVLAFYASRLDTVWR